MGRRKGSNKSVFQHIFNLFKNKTQSRKQHNKNKKFGQTKTGKMLNTTLNSDFQNTRAKQDKIDMENAHEFQKFDIIYDNIVQIIEQADDAIGAHYLSKLLESEIKKYGYEAVVQSLDNAPEPMVAKAQNICYMPSDQNHAQELHDALVEFSHIIRGNLPTQEEMMELSSILHQTEDYSTPN